MTTDEEQLLEAVELCYGWIFDRSKEHEVTLVQIKRVVDPLLHRYESDTLRRVLKQRAERRERGEETFK